MWVLLDMIGLQTYISEAKSKYLILLYFIYLFMSKAIMSETVVLTELTHTALWPGYLFPLILVLQKNHSLSFHLLQTPLNISTDLLTELITEFVIITSEKKEREKKNIKA